MKKIVFVLAVLLLLTSFGGCKEEKDILHSDGGYVFYSMYQFTSSVRIAKNGLKLGEELEEPYHTLSYRIQEEFPYPTAEMEEYELYTIRVGRVGLEYTYVYGDFKTMQSDKKIVVAFQTYSNSSDENRLAEQQASYIESGGVYYPEDNVIYNAGYATMYFRYKDTWASVYVTSSDLNTYDQLLTLCQYEIVSIYGANTPVQTTGTQATSAKATATN